ncbi:hypothetical protein J5491_03355 [Candidatus Saccharibacteria bacterium]|nr:hypothetical protein [Candidatus Saccharibacteria bacterium]
MKKSTEYVDDRAYMDISTGEIHHGRILRIDHLDETLRGNVKSRKRIERRRRNRKQSEATWRFSFVTMAMASIIGAVFLLMVTSNRLHYLGKISFEVPNIVVIIFGVTMTVLAVISVAGMITSRILERG